MRPGEYSTKRAIRQRHARDFAYSKKLLAAAHKLHRLLCTKEVRPVLNRSKAVAIGLWMKICKQYRSILVLSELGLVEDAEVIARSLFESTQWTLFVVKRNIRLSRGWATAPTRPRGGFSTKFRAEVYLARHALNEEKLRNVWRSKQGLKRPAGALSQAMGDMVQTAETWLGSVWMTWLRDKKKSAGAFKVETMAANVGLAKWYDAVYRRQSHIAHAGDALNHLDAGRASMTIDATLGADIERVPEPLCLANAMCLQAAHAVNARFCLGFDTSLKQLDAGALAVLKGP